MRSLLMDDEVRYISGPLLQQLDQDLQECERQSLLCLTANNHTSTQFFTGQKPFLLPNQQRQSISYSFTTTTTTTTTTV